MQDSTPIRILEKDNNRRGDLFARLMGDLFVALGYEPPRVNVHKSGRELDLETEHRLEPRRAVAECKATAKPIGGDDVNKFVGVLDAERGGRGKKHVTGYFVSLSGFRETAIEQERQGRRTKIITLAGPQVVAALVKGRILVPQNRATELAGRSCSSLPELEFDPQPELLAHERGWIWAVYYLQGGHRTHFALVLAEGTLLAKALVQEVIATDRDCGGSLHELICLNPAPPEREDEKRVQEARIAYFEYLANECGTLQLDGLPADSDVGSRRLRLENLFVPLHLDVEVQGGEEPEILERQTVGSVLAKHPRLALLAPPGGGKSTLVKRLASAYADFSRREEIADDLPDRDWLPLFFRCRELRSQARASFSDLLDSLSERDPVRQHATVFRAEMDQALLTGRVLLLVDGLDEISDPGDRAAFVCTVRSILQVYPSIAAVVTSREAGFRHVASHLTTVCTRGTLSPFDAEDIRRLTVAWHTEVVADTEQVRKDAEDLAGSIADNDRILRLAVNPLLLTTLLLVKRWVGTLPTRRAVLYGEAVKVLLRTWNVEGYDPLPEEEALPQLCYIASAMMLDGVQKISRPRLATLLEDAREALPTELGFVQGTVDGFIDRVENRSSLLMMTGLDVEDGRLVEFFEFRHLTFQEFLTARAMVEGWHPSRKDEDTLVSVLEPHIEDEKWREVIPLAAVLGGKQTDRLIQRLTARIMESDRRSSPVPQASFFALANCLADEAAAPPPTIRAALGAMVRNGDVLSFLISDILRDDRAVSSSFLPSLALGRYGEEYRAEASRGLFESENDFEGPGQALVVSVWFQVPSEKPGSREQAERFLSLLAAADISSRCGGALGFSAFCYRLSQLKALGQAPPPSPLLKSAGHSLQSMLFSDHNQEQWASAFALAWLGPIRAWSPPAEPDVLGRLFQLWQHGPHSAVRSKAGWALGRQVLVSRGNSGPCSSIEPGEVVLLMEKYDDLDWREKLSSLIVSWYLQVLDDADIAARAEALTKDGFLLHSEPSLDDLLERLGVSRPRADSRRQKRRTGRRAVEHASGGDFGRAAK